MTSEVVTCRPETDMERAAHLMWTHDCGVLPVLGEGGRVIGMLTDRDLAMGGYTRGRSLRDLKVEDSMSHEVHACLPTDPLENAIGLLGRRRVRRLPVIDEQGVLQGLLSLNDVIRFVESSAESPTRARLAAALLKSMASICEPHQRAAQALAPRQARSTRPAGELTVA